MIKSILMVIIATIVVLLTSCSNDDENSNAKLKISSNSNMTFSPATLNAKVGDQITFVIGPGHTATRVDLATWEANLDTSNGGFDFAEGTHTYTVQASDVGTIYYVCDFHVSMGMKGKIIVSNSSSGSGGGGY